MALARQRRANIKLPSEVNRILYVRNLPFKLSSEEIYDIFGRYGPIRQIRLGEIPGTAFVIYEDLFDAKNACDHLSGFNVRNRYLVITYYQPNKLFRMVNIKKKQEEINKMKSKYRVHK